MEKLSMNLNIHHNEHSDLSTTLENRYISENFSFGMSNIDIINYKKLIKKLKKERPTLTVNEIKIIGGKRFVIEDENILIFIGVYGADSSFVDFYTKERKEYYSLYSLLSKYFDSNEEFVVLRTSFYISDQLRTKDDNFKIKDFKDIIPEYYPEIDLKEFFHQFLGSEESILILSGKSGTGKTKFLSYMLKYLLENPKLLGLSNKSDFAESKDYISIAYIKNEKILAADDFWIQLKERSYDLVVLDDLDYFLSPRQQTASSEKEDNKDKFISELLSFSDGLVRNKTKFLISTNRDIDAVDEALQRDGRLFDIFSFKELTITEALVIWKKEGLKIKDFKKEFLNKTVLQATLGKTISAYKSNNGKALKSYLKNSSEVSVVSKFKKEKRVGFDI